MRDINLTADTPMRCHACLRKLKVGRAYREVPLFKSYGEDYNSLLRKLNYCIPCADRLGFTPQKPGEDEKYFWSGFERGIFASPFMSAIFLTQQERWQASNARKAFS